MKVQPCVQTVWAMRGKSNIKIEESIGRQGKTQLWEDRCCITPGEWEKNVQFIIGRASAA